jgi:hypothetical protein
MPSRISGGERQRSPGRSPDPKSFDEPLGAD